MATNSRYEYMNEESINERLKCSICARPFNDPVSTKCKNKKHTFCRHCIEDWIGRNPSCPTCRQELLVQDLTPITDGVFIDMLDELQISCQFCHQEGLERGNFDDHINKGCLKVNVSCPSADIKCPWIGSREQLDKHLNTCIFNPLRPLITQLREQSSGQQTQIEQLRSENEQLKNQVNRQQTQMGALQNETQQLKNQMKPLGGKHIHVVFQKLLEHKLIKLHSIE
jgi:FtsZ-binding cell division protein ZapB